MKDLKLNIAKIPRGIWFIVVTGGPCGGKTTGIARLKQMLGERGYKVLVSPESATKLINAGVMPGELPNHCFQEEVFMDILEQEDRILSSAIRYHNMGRKVIVLCDRGTLDGEAYVDTESFTKMLNSFGYTRRQLSDDRYHAVIHLRTAAFGAEEYYTLANNSARTETIEKAREIDQRTLDAWTIHQHPRVVDNSTDFQHKIRRLFAEICAIIGDPVPIENEDKFKIEPVSVDDLTRNVTRLVTTTIIQDYLMSPNPGEECRVRARGDGESFSYYYTTKREISPGVRVEKEKMITLREYESLLSLRDPNTRTIKKRRSCFFWKNQFFEIDSFIEPIHGLCLMELEKTEHFTEVIIPPFVRVLEKVTGDSRYYNRRMAQATA